MPKNVLVVDDDELVLTAIEDLLGLKNYVVTTAIGGREALEAVDSKQFDLIMLDVLMPGMDGYSLCRKIRDREEYKDIPVFMLTAKWEDKDRKKSERAGASMYLPKPISPQLLKGFMRQVLGE